MNFNLAGMLLYAVLASALLVSTLRFSIKVVGKYGYYVLILLGYAACAVAIDRTIGLSNFYSDSSYYHSRALEILTWWQGQGSSPYLDLWGSIQEKFVWPTIIAAIYWAVGPIPQLVVVINVLFLGLTSVFVAATVKLLKKDFAPNWAFAIYFLVAPFFAVFGLNIGREPIYWLATSAMVYFSTAFVLRPKLSVAALFGLSSLILIVIRPNLGIPQLYAFLVALIIVYAFKAFPYSGKRTIKFVIVCALVILSVFPAKTLVTSNTASIESTRSALSESATSGFDSESGIGKNKPGGSQESTNHSSTTSPSNLVEYARYSLTSMPRALLGPYVTEVDFSPVMLVALICLTYWLGLLVLAVIGIVKRNETKFGLFFLGISILIVAELAPLLTNYGILIRFRSIAALVLMPYAFTVIWMISSNRRKLTDKRPADSLT